MSKTQKHHRVTISAGTMAAAFSHGGIFFVMVGTVAVRVLHQDQKPVLKTP